MAIAEATVVVVVVIMAAAATVEGKGAAAPVDCTSVVLSMSDCLSYVTNGSTVEKPEGNCCSGLKSVLKTNADCLCQAFKSSSQFGVVLNVSKALSLPDACHVHAPSAAKCGLSLSPTGAPAPGGAIVSPAGAPSSSSIAKPPSAGFGGNEVSPAAAPSKTPSSCSAIGASVQLIFVAMAAAFFSSF